MALSACAPPIIPPPRAPARDPEIAVRTPAAPQATAATRLGGRPWRVDEVRIVWGGVRFEVRDGEVEVAGGLGAPIVAATRTDRGWLFSTEDGLLAHAREFLGPLDVVERWEGTASRVPARDRLVIAQHDALWTSIGGELSHHPLPAPFEAGAFLGDTGLVLAGGTLHETRDGARSWAPLDLGGALAIDVSLAEDGIAVMRTDGPFRWRDGSWVRASFPAEEQAIAVAAHEHLALLRAAAELPWMRLDADFLTELQDRAESLEEGCVEAAFGGAYAFARCARDGAAWWERRGGSRVVRIEVATADAPIVSPDGRTALWMTPCGAREGTACALVDDRASSVLIDGAATVIAVGAGRALIEHANAEPWARAQLVDLRTGQPTLVRFSAEARAALDAPLVELRGAWLSEHGPSVTISMYRESTHSRQLVLAEGDPAAGLRVRPLPLGA